MKLHRLLAATFIVAACLHSAGLSQDGELKSWGDLLPATTTPERRAQFEREASKTLVRALEDELLLLADMERKLKALQTGDVAFRIQYWMYWHDTAPKFFLDRIQEERQLNRQFRQMLKEGKQPFVPSKTLDPNESLIWVNPNDPTKINVQLGFFTRTWSLQKAQKFGGMTKAGVLAHEFLHFRGGQDKFGGRKYYERDITLLSVEQRRNSPDAWRQFLEGRSYFEMLQQDGRTPAAVRSVPIFVYRPADAAQPPPTTPQPSDRPRIGVDDFDKWWTKEGWTPEVLEQKKRTDPRAWEEHVKRGLDAEEYPRLQEILQSAHPEMFKPTMPVAKPPPPSAKPSAGDQLIFDRWAADSADDGTARKLQQSINGLAQRWQQNQLRAADPTGLDLPATEEPQVISVRQQPPTPPAYGPGTNKSGPAGQRPIRAYSPYQYPADGYTPDVISIRNMPPTPPGYGSGTDKSGPDGQRPIREYSPYQEVLPGTSAVPQTPAGTPSSGNAPFTPRIDYDDSVKGKGTTSGSKQPASSLRFSDSQATIGGIRLGAESSLLTHALQSAHAGGASRQLAELHASISTEPDPTKQNALINKYFHDLKVRLKTARSQQSLGTLTLVSLRSLAEVAHKHRDRPSALPAAQRTPGKLSRIHGYLLQPERGDILLVGTSAPEGPWLDFDDLVVALRLVWRDGAVPACSLDPDPDDFAARRLGPQKVRLIDLPNDTGFARTLLDADYAMKRILFGTDAVAVAEFTSCKSLIQQVSEPADITLQSRFWFMPVRFQPGDIQVAADWRAVVFNASVQCLTEQMTVDRDGMQGTGRTDVIAEQAAASMSKHFHAIAREQPHFRKLLLLNDLVMLCNVWRSLGLNAPLLTGLSQLPYRPVQVPTTYPGVKESVIDDGRYQCWLVGGVQMAATISPKAYLVLDDTELLALQVRAARVDFRDGPAVTLPDVTLSLPVPQPARPKGVPARIILQKLATQDFHGALVDAHRAVAADPEAPVNWTLRALAELAHGHVSVARWDVVHARELDPANTQLESLLLRIFDICTALSHDSNLALVPDRGLVVKAGSKEAHLLRGTILAMLDNIPAARAELQQAIAIDPSYAAAYARLALLEADNDWSIAAKKQAEKALALDPRLAEGKAVLALSELRLRHLTAAEKLAQEVLEQPLSDLQASTLAHKVFVSVAAKRDGWQQARARLRQAEQALPATAAVPVWLSAAEQAFAEGEKDLAATFVARAQRLALRSPQVKAARAELAKAGIKDLPAVVPDAAESEAVTPQPTQPETPPSQQAPLMSSLAVATMSQPLPWTEHLWHMAIALGIVLVGGLVWRFQQSVRKHA